jgi:hypothetical protein
MTKKVTRGKIAPALCRSGACQPHEDNPDGAPNIERHGALDVQSGHQNGKHPARTKKPALMT